MKWALLVVGIALSGFSVPIHARAPLGDPVSLNIGISCQWQQQCMKAQSKAMKRALKYVDKTQPPLWRVQTCNRNAGRQRVRVDWIGFDNCIRNPVLRPTPARLIKPVATSRIAPATPKKRVKTARKPRPLLTETAPQSTPVRPGERG